MGHMSRRAHGKPPWDHGTLVISAWTAEAVDARPNTVVPGTMPLSCTPLNKAYKSLGSTMGVWMRHVQSIHDGMDTTSQTYQTDTPKVLSRELRFPHGRSYQQNTCVKSRPQRWELGILMSLSYFQHCRWNQIKSGKRIRATRLGLPGWGAIVSWWCWAKKNSAWNVCCVSWLPPKRPVLGCGVATMPWRRWRCDSGWGLSWVIQKWDIL